MLNSRRPSSIDINLNDFDLTVSPLCPPHWRLTLHHYHQQDKPKSQAELTNTQRPKTETLKSTSTD
jgi:hypothetical protein